MRALGLAHVVALWCWLASLRFAHGLSGCPSGQKRVHNLFGDAGMCVPCPLGMFSEEGDSRCHVCPSGTVAERQGAGSCRSCEMGTFSASTSGCEPCPAGTVTTEPGMSACTQCSQGSVSPDEGGSLCSQCPAGQFSIGPTACAQCPAGTYSVFSECRDCAPGTFSGIGAAACQACPAGTFAGWSGATACAACEVGTFSTAGAPSCTTVDCPPHSLRVASGCRCLDGYHGTITWDEVAGTFNGNCLPCDMGTWSRGGDGCGVVPCPAHSTGHPLCECEKGYQGSLVWSGGMYSGVCTQESCPAGAARKGEEGEEGECQCVPPYGRVPGSSVCARCPPGHVVGTDGACAVVECPPLSSGHPECRCGAGFVGSITWLPDQGRYAGSCDVCPKGMWAAQGATSCGRLECPPNAVGHPDCECRAGYAGAVVWVGGGYSGSCERCPKGTWKSQGHSLECKRRDCPQNSAGHPDCVCVPGFFGTVEWAEDVGVYTGRCQPCPPGYWSDVGSAKCSRVGCPPNSAGHPTCECVAGFHGRISWDALAGFVGECAPCAPGQFQEENGQRRCKECGTGYTSNYGAHACIEQSCPPNSDGWPSCACVAGYTGQVTWNPHTLVYDGVCRRCPRGERTNAFGLCERVECPSGAAGHPFCQCPKGHAGEVVWDDSTSSFLGSCELLSCPPRSSGWPDCACDAGHAGLVTWDPESQTFLGECQVCENGEYQDQPGQTRCKPCHLQGFAPNVAGGTGATRCDPVPCPPRAFGHPQCECEAGTWSTALYWDAAALVFYGHCDACAPGTWAAPGATTCDTVPCPPNSEGHPNCRCLPGFQGTIAWNAAVGAFEGSCAQDGCPSNMAGSPCACLPGFVRSPSGTDCVPCPRYAHFNDTLQKCVPAKCPEHSEGYPDCRCNAGYYGALAWGDGGYQGSCRQCPEGFFSPPGARECTRVECPHDHGVLNLAGECVCKEGFEGEILFHHGTAVVRCSPCGEGFFSLQGGACEKVPCPDGAVDHPACVCDEGSSGVVLWDGSMAMYTGGCVDCQRGYRSEKGASCSYVPCPPNSKGHPNCECEAMFVGEVTWEEGAWVSTCERCAKGTISSEGSKSCDMMACPPFSLGWPDCECQPGYVGHLHWNEQLGEYSGTCNACPVGTYTEGGKCVPCKPGTWSFSHGSAACEDVPCPRHSRLRDKRCVCDDGFTGAVAWRAGAWSGECAACAHGFWASAGSPCVVVACPAHASGHPSCECDVGFTADGLAPAWNARAGRFIGGCKRCDRGTAPRTDQFGLTVCAPVPCPRNSVGHPGCTCRLGYAGEVRWIPNGKYAGVCTKCPPGMFGDGRECLPMPCPAHAINHPQCTCAPGYFGRIRLHDETNEHAPSNSTAAASLSNPHHLPTFYSGNCTSCPPGTTSADGSRCFKVPCPENASGHPTCRCDDGYAGKLVWNPSLHLYEGSCASVGCPAGATRSGVNGTCRCVAGYEASGKGGRNCTRCAEGFWSAPGRDCQPVRCPENGVGHPNCTCNEGFAGTIEWRGSGYTGKCQPCPPGYWSSPDATQCSPQPCPRDATGHPTCRCNAGFEGTVAWAGGEYQGSCSPCNKGFWSDPSEDVCKRQDCPPNAAYHPHCACITDFGGLITWDAGAGEYTGACTRCPAGYVSAEGAVECTPVECPAHSTNHPTCQCQEGFSGKLEWKNDARAFVGSCTPCPPGRRSSVDGSECVDVPCPEHSTGGNSACECDPGYQGQVHWSRGRYVGVCYPCPPGYTSVDGVCQSVACPNYAVAHPHCLCRTGFVGSIVWNGNTREYEGQCDRCPLGQYAKGGKCVAVPCSDPASRGEPCECADSFFGTIAWNEREGAWVGECSKCPTGHSSSAASREVLGHSVKTVCVATACPANAENHPYCTCAEGFEGLVTWEGIAYAGECVARASRSPAPSVTPSPSVSLSPSPSLTASPSFTPSPSPSASATPCREDVMVRDAGVDGVFRRCAQSPDRPRYCYLDWVLEWRPESEYQPQQWRLAQGLSAKFVADGPADLYLPTAQWQPKTQDGHFQAPALTCVQPTRVGCCVTYEFDDARNPCCFAFFDKTEYTDCGVGQRHAFGGEMADHHAGVECEAMFFRYVTDGSTYRDYMDKQRDRLAAQQEAEEESRKEPDGLDTALLNLPLSSQQVADDTSKTEFHVQFTLVLAAEGAQPNDLLVGGEVEDLVKASIAESMTVLSGDVNVLSAESVPGHPNFMQVRFDVRTTTQDKTADCLRVVRMQAGIPRGFQVIQRMFHTTYNFRVLDILDDASVKLAVPVPSPSPLPNCSELEGSSVELCTSRRGCRCADMQSSAGVSICRQCVAYSAAPYDPKMVMHWGQHGDEYDLAHLVNPRERAVLGLWRRTMAGPAPANPLPPANHMLPQSGPHAPPQLDAEDDPSPQLDEPASLMAPRARGAGQTAAAGAVGGVENEEFEANGRHTTMPNLL